MCRDACVMQALDARAGAYIVLQEGSVQGTRGVCRDACGGCSTSWRGVHTGDLRNVSSVCVHRQCVCKACRAVQAAHACAGLHNMPEACAGGHIRSVGVRPVPVWGRAAPYL